MVDNSTYDIIRQALNLLIVSCAPIVGVTAVAGVLIGIVQSATSIFDIASAYAVRLLALCAVLYLLAASVANALNSFFDAVFISIGSVH